MKIVVTLKDPDGFYEGVRDSVIDDISHNNLTDKLSIDEFDKLVEIRKEKAFKALTRWVEYQEVVTIEFDTETNEAHVLPVSA